MALVQLDASLSEPRVGGWGSCSIRKRLALSLISKIKKKKKKKVRHGSIPL